MKLKKVVILALVTVCSLSHTQISADNQIKPDDKFDAKTYIQWKTKEPQKIEQLKAYIQKYIPVAIDSTTLDKDIKRITSIYKSQRALTIDDLAKKICAKYMPKKKRSSPKRTKPKSTRPSMDIPTENMTLDQLKERLYKAQKEIELTLAEKYSALTIAKIALGQEQDERLQKEITASIQELNQKLEYLYFDRTSIIELSKRNGQKSVQEMERLVKEFDTLMEKIEKCYQDDLKEI